MYMYMFHIFFNVQLILCNIYFFQKKKEKKKKDDTKKVYIYDKNTQPGEKKGKHYSNLSISCPKSLWFS